jgi:hypothetical protein
MRPQADEIGQFVEHLVFDDRRLEIGDKHSLAAPGCGLHQHIDRRIADQSARRRFSVARRHAPQRQVASNPRGEPIRRAADRQDGNERGNDVGQSARCTRPGDQGHDRRDTGPQAFFGSPRLRRRGVYPRARRSVDPWAPRNANPFG